MPEISITGLGVVSSIGQGKEVFKNALLNGQHAFGLMQRAGRQVPEEVKQNSDGTAGSAFIGAEITGLQIPKNFPKRLLRTTSFSTQIALLALQEAWDDARLEDVDPRRIGLIVGGSNFQQRELMQIHASYKDTPYFVRPTYGMSFMDSDLCGACTEMFDIRGLAFTLGGASASGQLAVMQAAQAVQSEQVDVCIAIGALMDLSYWECLGFSSLGAMGSTRFANDPALAARPFDKDRDGFIFGESSGAVVIENNNLTRRSHIKPYARIAGWAMGMDGNRNPNPSLDGEINVVRRALEQANLSAKFIDYVNPHGTGSKIGDEIELQALRECGLDEAFVNTTKSIIGHGLSAAGAVEIIATLLQMQSSQLHPSRNLDTPIEASFNWVRQRAVTQIIRHAITLSMGFGGISSAVCLSQY